MEEEKITIVKAITINGNKKLCDCLNEIYKKHSGWGKIPNTITRSFLGNLTTSERARLKIALSDEIYNMLINGDIDLIAFHLFCKWDNNTKIDIMGDWFYTTKINVKGFRFFI